MSAAGMVEKAIKQVKEKMRTLVITTRELHGVVMDPEHVALAQLFALCRSDHFPCGERRR